MPIRRKDAPKAWVWRVQPNIALTHGLTWDDYPGFSVGRLYCYKPEQLPLPLLTAHWVWTPKAFKMSDPVTHEPTSPAKFLYDHMFGTKTPRLQQICAVAKCCNPTHWQPYLGTRRSDFEVLQPILANTPDPMDEIQGLSDILDGYIMDGRVKTEADLHSVTHNIYSKAEIDQALALLPARVRDRIRPNT